jgi:hypothetical protein
MPFLRFFLNTRIFGPRLSPSMTATTLAPDTNGADHDVAAVLADEQHVGDGHFIAGVADEMVHVNHGAGGDPDLPSAALDNRVHEQTPSKPVPLKPRTGRGQRT